MKMSLARRRAETDRRFMELLSEGVPTEQFPGQNLIDLFFDVNPLHGEGYAGHAGSGEPVMLLVKGREYLDILIWLCSEVYREQAEGKPSPSIRTPLAVRASEGVLDPYWDFDLSRRIEVVNLVENGNPRGAEDDLKGALARLRNNLRATYAQWLGFLIIVTGDRLAWDDGLLVLGDMEALFTAEDMRAENKKKSGGEKMMQALRDLFSRTEEGTILLLDEPFSRIDGSNCKEILGLLAKPRLPGHPGEHARGRMAGRERHQA